MIKKNPKREGKTGINVIEVFGRIEEKLMGYLPEKIRIKKQKEGTLPVVRVGVNSKAVKIMWGILIASFLFAVYKNFTAVDKHTVHEKEIIEEKVMDTNAMENFVHDYAITYYSWENSRESQEKRLKKLKKYTTEELQSVSAESVRSDIPTSSKAEEVRLWNTKKSGKNTYQVVFSVRQLITEGEEQKNYVSYYETEVYRDNVGRMVIIKNPTICGAYRKSGYQPKAMQNDGSVDADKQKEIQEFLETFFSLYPSAGKKELSYYVKDDALSPVLKEADVYLLSEVEMQGCEKAGKKVKVKVNVKYLDQQTKAVQISQYILNLQKDGNWMIVK